MTENRAIGRLRRSCLGGLPENLGTYRPVTRPRLQGAPLAATILLESDSHLGNLGLDKTSQLSSTHDATLVLFPGPRDW